VRDPCTGEQHVASFCIVKFLLGISVPLYVGEPTEAIRTAINQGVDAHKAAKLDSKKQSEPRLFDRLRDIVYPLRDFAEVSRRSLLALK
jgi:hypothetical protein